MHLKKLALAAVLVGAMPALAEAPETSPRPQARPAPEITLNAIFISDYIYPAELKRVVDGDTIDVLLYLGVGVYKMERLRFYGVDTPEVFGVRHGTPAYQRGLEASAFTKEWLEQCDSLLVDTREDNPRGKFGRLLADVFCEGDVISLNQSLIDAGHRE